MKELCTQWRRLAVVLFVLATVGCAGLPERVERLPSAALPGEGTALAQIAGRGRPADPALSGFRLLPTGEYAFRARIDLARRAERSLDVQYDLLENDTIGRRFLRELRDAALRGVRVRLLVDDLYTGHEDALLAGFAAHPNVEVRLFNPLPVRGGSVAWRFPGSLHQVDRINHRMHNKLFVADGTLSISGGRNMADEYLHAKMAIVDGRHVVVGSMNLDGHSAVANTELGIVIDSERLAEDMLGLVRDNGQASTRRVRLAANGEHLEWVARDASGKETVATREPDDNPWLRIKPWLLPPFASERLL